MENNALYCGHNVIQLYYPLHRLKGQQESMTHIMDHWLGESDTKWERVDGDSSDDTGAQRVYHDLRSIFPAAYFMKRDGDELAFCGKEEIDKAGFNGFNSYREWIEDQYVKKYFHPAFRDVIEPNQPDHHEQGNAATASARLDIARYRWRIREDQRIREAQSDSGYPGLLYMFSLGERRYLFEWLSYELFVFSEDIAIAVARLSLLENHRYVTHGSHGAMVFVRNVTDIHRNLRLTDWMLFSDHIRQIYMKLKMENFNIEEVRSYQAWDQDSVRVEVCMSSEQASRDPRNFFDVIREAFPLPQRICFSEVADPNDQVSDKNLEPNAFIHSYVQWDGDITELSDAHLFSLLSVDGWWNGSGNDAEFIHHFNAQHILRRWLPYTVYTAIDYAAVTVVRERPQYLSGESERNHFPDLLYQHHTRQYEWFVLFQLYYRNVLQDLARQYAAIGPEDIEGRRARHRQAKQILRDYYFLNQYRFFARVTNEIQGLELWSLYHEALGIKHLFQAVREDVRELNQRLIESHGVKQESSIQRLTVLGVFLGTATVLFALAGLKMSDVVTKAPRSAMNHLLMTVGLGRQMEFLLGFVFLILALLFMIKYYIASKFDQTDRDRSAEK